MRGRHERTDHDPSVREDTIDHHGGRHLEGRTLVDERTHHDEDVHRDDDPPRTLLRHRHDDDQERVHDHDRSGAVEPERTSDRYGGIDLGAVIGGLFACLGCMLLLGLVATALGVAGSDLGRATATDLTIGAGIAGAVILVLSSFVGGWVAGRIARYDGSTNGGLTAFAFLLLVGLSVAIGGDVSTDVTDVRGLLGTDILPGVSSSDLSILAGLGALAVVLLSILVGGLGGRIGDGYHRRADHHITERVAAITEQEADMIHGRGDASLTESRERATSGRMR